MIMSPNAWLATTVPSTFEWSSNFLSGLPDQFNQYSHDPDGTSSGDTAATIELDHGYSTSYGDAYFQYDMTGFEDDTNPYTKYIVLPSYDIATNNLVSGSIDSGTTIHSAGDPVYYGLLYPSLGIAILDGTKLNLSASFGSVTGSGINGDNAAPNLIRTLANVKTVVIKLLNPELDVISRTIATNFSRVFSNCTDKDCCAVIASSANEPPPICAVRKASILTSICCNNGITLPICLKPPSSSTICENLTSRGSRSFNAVLNLLIALKAPTNFPFSCN